MEIKHSFSILIVDDEASVVDSLAETLPWKGIGIESVFKAFSGFEALEILKTHAIDILITDIRMPGMSGLELLDRVRQNWKKTKSILLSGHAEFSYAQQAIQHKTCDYLLKPISDEEVLLKIQSVVQSLQTELEENITQQRSIKALEENLPKLKGELLNELLLDGSLPLQRLTQKLDLLNVPIAFNDSFALMLVRTEGDWTEMDFYSLSLMEYAIENMAAEIFEDEFQLWACKDIYGYLVFLVIPKNVGTGSYQENRDIRVQLMASQLQLNVNHYLKGTISVLVSPWGTFPNDVVKLYQSNLLAVRRQVGDQSGLFVCVTDQMEQYSVRSMQRLYEPPNLIHLLESGNWDAIDSKLTGIFEELNRRWAESNEHLVEAFFSIYSTFSSFAHKNGRELSDMIGSSLSNVVGLTACRSVTSLGNWTMQALHQVKLYMENEARSDREDTIRKIQSYVKKHLVEDISLQAIADHLYMHPVHVSRIYKLVTGENLSDFVLRLKMELASTLLTSSGLKTYEIASQLGYHNPNYFIKVFKKYYSLTPQEFRVKLGNIE